MAQSVELKRRFLEWMRFQGTIERREYVIAGGVLFALKHNIDRIVATQYGVKWSVFNYISAAVPFYPQASSADMALFAALALVAIPFVWIGIALTEARLRRTGLPLWLALLFFVPFVNLIFFAVLCVLPPGKAEPRESSGEFALRSALTSIVVVGLLGVSLTLVATKALATYGLGLFLGVPFMLGFVAAVVFNWDRLRGRGATFAVAFLAVAVVGIALEALAIEGLVCLLMALPMAAILAFAGALLAYQIRRASSSAAAARAVTAVILVVPALLAGEKAQPAPAGRYAVVTSIEIKAPADVVWREVIAFSPITEPRDFVLRTGIAYPITARITRSGPGAVRYCVFNDGAFVEPIRVWDAPRRLAFDVEEQPDAMAELSPYRDLRPPHIAGQYFRSRQGEFLLTALSADRTRLQGTTWYEMRYWPQPYWRLWSDTIVHHIHLRVLEHIKNSAEADARSLHHSPAE